MPGDSFVYVIAHPRGMRKIGYAGRPTKRMAALQRVIFIAENGDGPGVRLRKRRK